MPIRKDESTVNKENKTLYLFVIGIITALAIIAGIFVGMSDILVNSKFGFVVIIFGFATIAVCSIVGYRDNRLNASYFKQFADAKDEADKYKERMMEVAEERDSLKAQLDYYTSGAVKEEYETLKNKCEAIETFRNSFPYKISDGYILYNIMRTGLQVGKSSTWQIVGDYNGDLWECSIVRPHTQSYKELLALVSTTHEPNEVGALNQSEALLWE